MPKSEVNALTLVAVLIAAGLSGTMVPDHSVLALPLGGLVLLIVLYTFDREGYRDMGQSLGFGAVAGYCAARVIWPLLGYLVGGALGSLPWFSITWIVATLILWAIDLSRMQRRVAVQPYAAGPIAVQPAPPVATPVAVEREEAFRGQTPSRTPAARHSNVTSLFSQAPIVSSPQQPTPQPLPPEPPPATPFEDGAAVFPSPVAPVPVAAPPAPPRTPLPQPVQVPRGSGKPATIYLNLIGEGLAVMRSVQAEHIGKDFYLIVEPMPPNENWEFQTGQVVRCQKRNLSSGKGLVAVEEAPRAS